MPENFVTFDAEERDGSNKLVLRVALRFFYLYIVFNYINVYLYIYICIYIYIYIYIHIYIYKCTTYSNVWFNVRHIDYVSQTALNVGRLEDITLPDPYRDNQDHEGGYLFSFAITAPSYIVSISIL